MIWLARLGIMALCAEWLIILRMWMAPHVLLLTIGVAALRYYALYFLPHVTLTAFIFVAGLSATLWRLRALWRGTSAASRRVHEAPDIGVPWLLIVARREKFVALLELALVIAAVAWVSYYGLVIYPETMLRLPPEWTAWFVKHGAFFTGVVLWAQPVGIILWHVIHMPRRAREEAPAPPQVTYERVARQPHTPPQLPSIKELTDDLP